MYGIFAKYEKKSKTFDAADIKSTYSTYCIFPFLFYFLPIFEALFFLLIRNGELRIKVERARLLTIEISVGGGGGGIYRYRILNENHKTYFNHYRQAR